MARLHKQLREYAHGYYLAQARRLKKWEKHLNKASQAALLVRYCFKIGFFYEVQGNAEKCGRYYRAAYDFLAELPPQKQSRAPGKNSTFFNVAAASRRL